MVVANVVQAVNMAMKQELANDEHVVIMGEDVGKNGGVFRATDGIQAEFGENRVIDTPLAELGIVGTAIGMALNGMKPIAEIQFSGFMYAPFDQLFSHAARIRRRTRGTYTCPLVVRAPYGGGIRALELHCESGESIFAHVPGLKVVIPSNPYDAKGLLASAVEDPDPVVFFEPMRIYRAIKQEIPEERYTVPLGKAQVVQEGNDVTLISWGSMMHRSLEALKNCNHSVEAVDLRTINPFDEETVLNSVKKTGRCVIVHEAPKTAGFAAELIATINEKALLNLQAPVQRVTSPDVPYPLAKLENYYLPTEKRILSALDAVMKY